MEKNDYQYHERINGEYFSDNALPPWLIAKQQKISALDQVKLFIMQ